MHFIIYLENVEEHQTRYDLGQLIVGLLAAKPADSSFKEWNHSSESTIA